MPMRDLMVEADELYQNVEEIMDLQPHDLHLILSRQQRRLEVWNAAHHSVFTCEARNRTTRDGQYGHYGNCPPGEFELGPPVRKGTDPFGPWFVPILDYNGHHAMRDHGRSGIGLHGGGSHLPHPMASHQGWVVTHGCWRLQNEDLIHLMVLVHEAQSASGQCYCTVEAPPAGVAPGASAEEAGGEPYTEVDERLLDPAE
jgi:hypothetical protein